MSKKTDGSGFTFGVALGAIIGTGAMIFARTKEGRHLQDTLENKISQTTKSLKEKYPQQVEEVEEILKKALFEAQKATKEIKDLSSQAESIAKKKSANMSKAISDSKNAKRTFSRSGKNLSNQ